MNMATLFTVLGFLWDHREEVKKTILMVQEMYSDYAGPEKAKVVKDLLAKATGVGDQLEAVWPVVQPFFDRMVAKAKGKA